MTWFLPLQTPVLPVIGDENGLVLMTLPEFSRRALEVAFFLENRESRPLISLNLGMSGPTATMDAGGCVR